MLITTSADRPALCLVFPRRNLVAFHRACRALGASGNDELFFAVHELFSTVEKEVDFDDAHAAIDGFRSLYALAQTHGFVPTF